MVRSEDLPGTTLFTEWFSRVLRVLVDEAGVSRQAIAEEVGRSRAFVSDQLLGKRPVDTDVLAATAVMFGISARDLAQRVLDRFPADVYGVFPGQPGYEEQVAATRAAIAAFDRRFPPPERRAAASNELDKRRKQRQRPKPNVAVDEAARGKDD